jgi:hypothetical protein
MQSVQSGGDRRTGLKRVQRLPPRQRIRLLEDHLPRDVNVEQMDLSVQGDERAFGIVDRAGIVDAVGRFFVLGNGTCYRPVRSSEERGKEEGRGEESGASRRERTSERARR